MWQEDEIIKIKIAAVARSTQVWGGRWASRLPVRVQTGAARRGAWAGNEWTGASAEPCDPAAASPARSARQTSACRRASSGGRRTCCSRSPQCAPWTCSSGCTSPVIRGWKTVRLREVITDECWANGWLLFPLCCSRPASKKRTKVNVCCCSKRFTRRLQLITCFITKHLAGLWRQWAFFFCLKLKGCSTQIKKTTFSQSSLIRGGVLPCTLFGVLTYLALKLLFHQPYTVYFSRNFTCCSKHCKITIKTPKAMCPSRNNVLVSRNNLPAPQLSFHWGRLWKLITDWNWSQWGLWNILSNWGIVTGKKCCCWVFECQSLMVSVVSKPKTPRYLIIPPIKPNIFRIIWVNRPI